MARKPLMSRIVHAFSVFNEREDYAPERSFMGGRGSTSRNPSRIVSLDSDRSITAALYTRIAIDAAAIDILHVRLDENGRYQEKIESGLNECLSIGANVDQEGRQFRQDIVHSLLDEGAIAIVPVITSLNPQSSGGYDIRNMRVGKIVEWFAKDVRVSLWNEETGMRQEITVPKSTVAIVENPLAAVMNEPNSMLKRLLRKLAILDLIDEQSGSGKLDLIIQLPYTIKTEARRAEAEKRRKDIEFQLQDSRYGVAYTDGVERVTQLNRPAENNLLKQVEYLMNLVHGQLGMTPEVFDGTADEKVMLNYNNRTIEPIITAITEAMHRTFLTKTARSQKQAVIYLRNPFKLVPVNNMAEIADKFTRNEILSANEIRSVIGFQPSKDPKADELRNSNMPDPNEEKTVVVDEKVEKSPRLET